MLNRLVFSVAITFTLLTVVQAQPAAPQLKTAAAAEKAVQLSWSAVPGATQYKIYWRTAAGVTTANATGNATNAGIAFTVPSLTNGTPYYFVVTAANAAGESATSNELSATPATPPPAPLKTTPVQPTTNVGQSPDTNVQNPTMTYAAFTPGSYPVVAAAAGTPSGNIVYNVFGVEKLINDACATAFASPADFAAAFNEGQTYTIINVINLKGEIDAQNVASNNWYLYSKGKTFASGFAGGWKLTDFDGATRLYGAKRVLLLSIIENNLAPAAKDSNSTLLAP
jgi:hypothetical protein